MKEQFRVMAIDDGPFKFKEGMTEVVGLIVRVPNYVEKVLSSTVAVDGTDATEVVITLIKESGVADQLKCLFLDGIALGGFNVVDVEEVFKRTSVPIITITRERPDMEGMEKALQKHFQDWEHRIGKIASRIMLEMDTGDGSLFISLEGIDEDDARLMIKRSIVRGATPEPLRLAHTFASRKRV